VGESRRLQQTWKGFGGDIILKNVYLRLNNLLVYSYGRRCAPPHREILRRLRRYLFKSSGWLPPPGRSPSCAGVGWRGAARDAVAQAEHTVVAAAPAAAPAAPCGACRLPRRFAL
jgi:hypothetical protein